MGYPPHRFILQEDWRELYGVITCAECSLPEYDVTHEECSNCGTLVHPDSVPCPLNERTCYHLKISRRFERDTETGFFTNRPVGYFCDACGAEMFEAVPC